MSAFAVTPNGIKLQNSGRFDCICATSVKFLLPLSRKARRLASRPQRATYMMAEFKKGDESGRTVDEDSALDSLVPKVDLPTLSTLSGLNAPIVIDEELIPDSRTQTDSPQSEANEFGRMGMSISTEEEDSILTFLNEVFAELKQIEWPSAARVAKITVIILVSILVAGVGIYIVDGFFYSVAKILFETSPQ